MRLWTVRCEDRPVDSDSASQTQKFSRNLKRGQSDLLQWLSLWRQKWEVWGVFVFLALTATRGLLKSVRASWAMWLTEGQVEVISTGANHLLFWAQFLPSKHKTAEVITPIRRRADVLEIKSHRSTTEGCGPSVTPASSQNILDQYFITACHKYSMKQNPGSNTGFG